MQSVLGYLRVSTDEQANGYGFDVQRKRIEQFCRQERLPLFNVFEDVGCAGHDRARRAAGPLCRLLGSARDRDDVLSSPAPTQRGHEPASVLLAAELRRLPRRAACRFQRPSRSLSSSRFGGTRRHGVLPLRRLLTGGLLVRVQRGVKETPAYTGVSTYRRSACAATSYKLSTVSPIS